MSKQLLLIFMGGGLGSCLRFLFSIWINENQIKWLPTLIVNSLGCLLLGVFVALLHKNELNPAAYTLLGIGFCGGLTTFSTFSLDLFQLMRSGNFISAMLYVGATLTIGFMLLYAGYTITKQVV